MPDFGVCIITTPNLEAAFISSEDLKLKDILIVQRLPLKPLDLIKSINLLLMPFDIFLFFKAVLIRTNFISRNENALKFRSIVSIGLQVKMLWELIFDLVRLNSIKIWLLKETVKSQNIDVTWFGFICFQAIIFLWKITNKSLWKISKTLPTKKISSKIKHFIFVLIAHSSQKILTQKNGKQQYTNLPIYSKFSKILNKNFL